MTSPTSSAAKHRGPLSMIARRWRHFRTTPSEECRPAASLHTGFRKYWKELAPGQWQVLQIYDEADQKK